MSFLVLELHSDLFLNFILVIPINHWRCCTSDIWSYCLHFLSLFFFFLLLIWIFFFKIIECVKHICCKGDLCTVFNLIRRLLWRVVYSCSMRLRHTHTWFSTNLCTGISSAWVPIFIYVLELYLLLLTLYLAEVFIQELKYHLVYFSLWVVVVLLSKMSLQLLNNFLICPKLSVLWA